MIRLAVTATTAEPICAVDPVNFRDTKGLLMASPDEGCLWVLKAGGTTWDQAACENGEGGFGGGGGGSWFCSGGLGFAPIPDPSCYSPEAAPPAPEPPAYAGCRNWECMPAALAKAKQWLQKPDCAALFGSAETRGQDFDPQRVIDQVYSRGGGSVAGQYVSAAFAPIMLWPALTIPALQGGASVIIDSSPWDLWNLAGEVGYVSQQAEILLHELGHVYNALQGSGGSRIVSDGGFSSQRSIDNTNLIRSKCGN